MPQPKQHTLRDSGLFAPHATHRAKLQALLPAPSPTSHSAQDPNETEMSVPNTAPDAATAERCLEPAPIRPSRPSRIAWASLLRRVFHTDVQSCAKCGGSLTLIALITEAAVISRILTHLGLPADPPDPKPVRLAYLAPMDDAFTEDPTPPPPTARGPPIAWLRLPPT